VRRDPQRHQQPTHQTAQSTAETSPIVYETSPIVYEEAPKSPEPEPEPEPEPTPETVKVGEKVRDDGYPFTVTKVTCGCRG
jgi:hypothetical protein